MGFMLIVAIIVIVVIASAKSAKAAQKKWESAAQTLGLRYLPGGVMGAGSISGTSHGHRVAVTTFTRSSGKSSQTYTKYTLHYRERFSVDFRMSRQGFMQGLGQVFGLHDIEVGNPDFDDTVLVKGGYPDAVIEFLTPFRQHRIRQMVLSYTEVVITNEYVEVIKRGKDTEPGVIVHCVRALLSFCGAVTDEAQGIADDLAHPIVEEVEQSVPEAVEPSYDPFIPPNPIIPNRSEIPELPEEEPGMEVELEEIIEEPIVLDEPVSPEEQGKPTAASVLDVEEVAAALFGGDTGSLLLASKVFDDQYKDRRVAGLGTLKRVGKFSYDPVFTNCIGVKATFEICELAGAYSKTKVIAEVKFPMEEYDALNSKIDMSFPITGNLIAQDATMHRLYIADD